MWQRSNQHVITIWTGHPPEQGGDRAIRAKDKITGDLQISKFSLPAIEPDASKTIMASSVQGSRCGSSARKTGPIKVISTARLAAAADLCQHRYACSKPTMRTFLEAHPSKMAADCEN
jgi:hypothetical protein